MTFPLGFDILQSELDAIVNMRSEKATSLLWARAQQRSLQANKPVSGFARCPDRRPAGVVPADDGSLDVDHIWTFLGRRLGFSLQHIADHAISDSGRRRFLLRSDSEGRTWVSAAGPFRRMPRRHRHRPRRGTQRDEDEPSHTVTTRTGAAAGTPGVTALDPVSVSSDEDDDVAAFASNASVEPDDTAAAALGVEVDVKQECHHDSESEPDSFPPTIPDATPDITLDCKLEPSDDVPPLGQVTPESAPPFQNAPSPSSPVQLSAGQMSDILFGGIPSPPQPAFHDLEPWSSLLLP